jgi:hypothetical protein
MNETKIFRQYLLVIEDAQSSETGRKFSVIEIQNNSIIWFKN